METIVYLVHNSAYGLCRLMTTSALHKLTSLPVVSLRKEEVLLCSSPHKVFHIME